MTLNDFMLALNRVKGKLTAQQFKTLKGQALAGDIDGANKGLKKLLAAKKEAKVC